MAEVFLAVLEGPEGFARKVAIKLVHPDTVDDGHLLALVDEARVAAMLRHPNIVQVIELERHEEGFYLVMEYLDGRPLDQLMRTAGMRGEPPGTDVTADIGLQALDALSYAHAACGEDGKPLELVHRDIKPSNLMISNRGLLTVVDFGIARAAPLARRTTTGAGKGTPAYMSPEQMRGAPVGPSSDIFSLGTVLYELATGHRLFDADSLIALVHRRQQGISDDDITRLREHAPDLVDVILPALAQDPLLRWQTADAMAEELRKCSPAHPRVPLKEWGARVGDGTGRETRDQPMPGAQTPDASSSPRAERVPHGWVAGVGDLETPPTRLVDRVQASPDGFGATRDMNSSPPPGSRRRRARAWLAGLAAGAGALGLWIHGLSTPSDPTTQAPADGIEAASASPTPETASEPARQNGGLLDPKELLQTPMEAGRATPLPAAAEAPPTPEATPAAEAPPAPEATPAPVSAVASSSSASAAPRTAKGMVYVQIAGGGGGQVEVPGFGLHDTPHTFRLPAGRHVLRLLDQHDGLLADYDLAVDAGEDARCLWKRAGANLNRIPDPDGAPCRAE